MDVGFVSVALLIALLWAINPILIKYILDDGLDSRLVLALTSSIYFICMIVFVIWNWKPIVQSAKKKLTLQIFCIVAFSSIFTAFLANYLNVQLLKNHPSYIVTAITFSSPLFTLILASFFLGEMVNIYGIIGVVLIVVGIGMVAQ